MAPAPVSAEEVRFIRETVQRFYGDNAVVRNFGPDPTHLELHVETDIEPSFERYDCLGELMCKINRDHFSLEVTKRGRRILGRAKIAYRQGVVL
jgi:hypothetical protein